MSSLGHCLTCDVSDSSCTFWSSCGLCHFFPRLPGIYSWRMVPRCQNLGPGCAHYQEDPPCHQALLVSRARKSVHAFISILIYVSASQILHGHRYFGFFRHTAVFLQAFSIRHFISLIWVRNLAPLLANICAFCSFSHSSSSSRAPPTPVDFSIAHQAACGVTPQCGCDFLL